MLSYYMQLNVNDSNEIVCCTIGSFFLPSGPKLIDQSFIRIYTEYMKLSKAYWLFRLFWQFIQLFKLWPDLWIVKIRFPQLPCHLICTNKCNANKRFPCPVSSLLYAKKTKVFEFIDIKLWKTNSNCNYRTSILNICIPQFPQFIAFIQLRNKIVNWT